MFRLKSLPNNSTPESLSNPKDTSAPVSALTPAYPLYLQSSPATFIAAQPNRFTHMVTAGAVFYWPQHQSLDSQNGDPSHVTSPAYIRNEDQPSFKATDQNLSQHDPGHATTHTPSKQGPYLLLVQRAVTDTYPLHWELPGGMVDPTDKTLFKAVAREVREETGLLVKEVKGQVLPAEVFNTGWHRRMKKWIKVTFLVEVAHSSPESEGKGKGLAIESKAGAAAEDEARAVVVSGKENAHDGATADGTNAVTVADDEAAEKEIEEAVEHVSSISLARIAELEDNTSFSAPPSIKLNPSEHQAFLWVTEAEVRDRKIKDMELLFVCDEQVEALLGAFALHSEIYKTGKE